MAAVLPYIETQPEANSPDRDPAMDEALKAEKARQRGLKKIQPEHALSIAHTELTKLGWARSLIARALVGRAFQLERDAGRIYVRVVPGLPADVVPWHKSGGNTIDRFQLFSTNSKMAVPTFDLPSGIPSLGGSCPGAIWAQSSVEAHNRQTDSPVALKAAARMTHDGGTPRSVIDLNTAVCERCYASGGKYGEVVVQFSEVARSTFVRTMMANAKDRELLVSVLVETITQHLSWPTPTQDASMRWGKKPIRVHSSGDFFSVPYAQLWMEVARRVGEIDPAVLFWAPTRTHVLPNFAQFWATPGSVPKNFVVRPSAYHVGDDAPKAQGLAAGTSVLTVAQAAAELDKNAGDSRNPPNEKLYADGRVFDFQCGVYALAKGNKTCKESTGPDGKVGCRACWTQPHLGIDYAFH